MQIRNCQHSSKCIFSCNFADISSGLQYQVVQDVSAPPHQYLQAGLGQAGGQSSAQMEAGHHQPGLGQVGHLEALVGQETGWCNFAGLGQAGHHEAGPGCGGLSCGLWRSCRACRGPCGGNDSSVLSSCSTSLQFCPWRMQFSLLGKVGSFLARSYGKPSKVVQKHYSLTS